MANRQYKDFPFGFLNSAQDSADVSDFESIEAVNLDPDKLALGSLEYRDFSTDSPVARDYLETTMGGRRFFLGTTELATTFGNGEYSKSDVGDYRFDVRHPHTIAFEFKDVSGAGFLLGNINIGGLTKLGEMCIYQSSTTQITIEFFSPAGAPTSIVCTAPAGVDLTDGEWHKFVVTTTPSGSNYILTAFVDSSITYPGAAAYSVAESFGGFVFIGGNTTDVSTATIKNVNILYGHASTPGEFDGTSKSLNILSEWGVHTDSPVGSGVDNFAGKAYTITGTPTVTNSTSKEVGPLRYEVTTDPRDRVVPGRTSVAISVKIGPSSTTINSVETTTEIPVADSFVLAVDFEMFSVGDTTGYLNEFFSITKTAGTSDGRFDLVDNVGELKVRLNSVLSSSVPYAIGQRMRAVLVSEPRNATEWVNQVYINGASIIKEVTTGALFSSAYVNYQVGIPTNSGSGANTTGTTTYFYTALIANRVAKTKAPALWNGDTQFFGDDVNIVYSVSSGDIENDDQEWGTSGSPITYESSTSLSVAYTDTPLVARNESPTKPKRPETDYAESLDVSFTTLSGGTLDSVGVREGLGYDGPETFVRNYQIIVDTESRAGAGTTEYVFKLASSAIAAAAYADRGRAIVTGANTVALDHNLVAKIPSGTSSGAVFEFRVTVQATKLVDGSYTYKLVAIRKADMSPAVEVASLPSDAISVEVKNLDETGKRIANDVPLLNLPPVLVGHPDRVDRIDIYRKDPDAEEFVKVGEYTLGGSLEPWVDDNSILDLPKVELLDEGNDENFSTIDDAIGNSSGNYSMVFNKDSRLWVVPTDRKDLLLYSRAFDWWGWNRENSFSVNGNITNVAILRDPTVVSGLQTLVVTTTKGIYHITGDGTEAAPYALIPMFGGDGFTDLEVAESSMVTTNGAIMLMTKSSDGGYETGTYGQKIYEYDLQKLTEVSGRIRGDVAISGTGTVSYANISGGDKYILKKADQTEGVVYHRDARGWIKYDNTESGWKWTSKHFPREMMSRGNPAFARQLKIDYIGDITLTFYFEKAQEGDISSKVVSLSSSGQRREWQNAMPASMGRKWWMTLEGDATSKVYGFWFVT